MWEVALVALIVSVVIVEHQFDSDKSSSIWPASMSTNKVLRHHPGVQDLTSKPFKIG